jgi:hypothetical protein
LLPKECSFWHRLSSYWCCEQGQLNGMIAGKRGEEARVSYRWAGLCGHGILVRGAVRVSACGSRVVEHIPRQAVGRVRTCFSMSRTGRSAIR